MAYDVKGLKNFAVGAQPLVGGNQSGQSHNLYHYSTPDAHATVLAANYFNSAAALLKVGDILFCTVASGGTPQARIYIVTANTGTVVTIVQQIFTA